MAFKQLYNPLSGQFDFVPVNTGYLEVANFAALPLASDHTGEIYVCLAAQGNWYTFNRKPAGFYLSNGSTWVLLDDLPDFVKDAEFRVQNSVDQTKQLAFNVAEVGTGTTATLTVPNKSDTIATIGDVYISDI